MTKLKYARKVLILLIVYISVLMLVCVPTSADEVDNTHQNDSDESISYGKSEAVVEYKAAVALPGCDNDILQKVKDYYISQGVYISGSDSLKCSIDPDIEQGYKKVLLQYKDDTGELAYAVVWTNIDFAIDDVSLSFDNGQLIVSGLMYDDRDAWNIVFDGLQKIIVGITGIATFACVLGFVMQFIRLGVSAGNPAERERVIKGILWTGIGTVGCGAITFVFSFAFNFI